MKSLKTLLSVSAGMAVALCADAHEKPNLIYVFADQWRACDVGYAGNQEVMTPNIDRLAGQSLVVGNMVSNCPVSAAYRGTLLTGTYPLTHGLFYNDKPIVQNLTFLGEAFAKGGYNTAYIGKWHVDGRGRETFIPRERRGGFDYWKVLECSHSYNNSKYYGDTPDTLKWEGYDAIAQTADAVQYIKSRDRDKPFALLLSWGPPHSPYNTAPQEFRDLYKSRELKLRDNVPASDAEEALKAYRGYYSHIAALDKCMGELLTAISNEGIERNTIVVFTSDHGDMLFSQGQRNKQQPWDESIRVPFLIRYPAQLGDKSRTVNTPVGAVNIMPTLLGMCGLPIPRTVEGADFSSFFKGKATAPDTVALIASYSPFHQWSYKRGGREFRGIRTPRYTYVRTLDGSWLLYDNRKDPYQLLNLVDNTAYTALQKHLNTVLDNKLKSIGDDFRCGHYYMNKWNYAYDQIDMPLPPCSRCDVGQSGKTMGKTE